MRKDGRQHLVTITPSGKKSVVSYPKYIMEKYLGHYLNTWQTVHHKDGDFTNNNIENLEIINNADHVRYHCDKLKKSLELTCVLCGTQFRRYHISWEKHNRKQGKFGPFCSKHCAGKWAKNKQLADNVLKDSAKCFLARCIPSGTNQ
jgi:endogenous inhibitor of DNA gyrase (YacG/DUF329 family)